MPEPKDTDPITLQQACELVFDNAITPAALRAEAKRGNLNMFKVGRRHFTTRHDLKEMQKKCRLDLAEKDLVSTSKSSAPGMDVSRLPVGSSEMARANSAQAALEMTLQALSGP